MARLRSSPQLVGNRMVLAGAVVFLLEWVGLIWGGILGVGNLAIGAPTADLVAAYQGHENVVALMEGWLSIVLLGRILFIVGLRSSFVTSSRPNPLMDFAVGAMIVSVALEIAACGLYAGAAQLGTAHLEGMVAVQSAGDMVFGLVFGPIGLSVLCSAWVMWRSGLFPTVLNILGIIAGVGMTVMTMFGAPAFASVADALGISGAVLWIWIFWTGVLLWIRTPKQAAVAVQSLV